MRVLCDTNVLVRAFISPHGPAAELLTTIATEHLLIVSLPVLSELYEVLRRPKIRRLHGLSEAGIRRAVSRLYKLACAVSLPPEVPSAVPYDPNDDPIVMTAIVGKANVLCTLDHHFYAQSVVDLCGSHGIRIKSDAALLAELR